MSAGEIGRELTVSQMINEGPWVLADCARKGGGEILIRLNGDKPSDAPKAAGFNNCVKYPGQPYP